MFNHRILATLLAVVAGFSFVSPAAAEGASAEMLSNTCLGCHGPGGISEGPATPTISGMSEIYIIGAMLAYKYDNDEDKVDEIIEADVDFEDVEFFARTSTVMNRISKGYSEAEIKTIAKHFANLPFEAAIKLQMQAKQKQVQHYMRHIVKNVMKMVAVRLKMMPVC